MRMAVFKDKWYKVQDLVNKFLEERQIVDAKVYIATDGDELLVVLCYRR